MHEDLYEEDALVVDASDGPVTHLHGRKALMLFLWFGFLAVAVGPANALHLGFKGVVLAMLAASMAVGLLAFLVKGMRRKMAEFRLSKRQWLSVLMGVPRDVVDADAADRLLLPDISLTTTKRQPSTALPPAATQLVDESCSDDDEELPDSILEENGLFLSERLCPSINHFLGQIILLAGIRRMGKSNLLAVFLEEVAPFFLPLLVIDTDDEYAPLCDHTYLPRGMLAGSAEGQTLLHIPQCHYLVISDTNAYHLGRQMLEQSLQVVLNMKSYESDDQAAHVLCHLIRGMYDWQASRPNSQRIPVLLAMDEASKWLPENPKRSCVEPSTQQLLYNTFFGIVVNRGGKQGFGAIFATQRIQDIHKSTLQAPWKFFFYQAQRVDLEQYATFGLDEEEVLSLRPGECFVFGPHILGFRCFMRIRTSPHLGHTPGLDQLHTHQQGKLRPLHTLHFSRSGIEEQIAFHRHEDRVPPGNREQDESTEVPEASTETTRPASAVPESQHQGCVSTVAGTRPSSCAVNGKVLTEIQYAAYQLHLSGKDTIVSLAAALSTDGRFGRIDTNRANTLRSQLEALGLITLRRRSVLGGE